MKNYKFINDWLAERGLSLANSFAATLREKAKEFAVKNGMKLCEVYSLLGCSRQNVSYWELHSDSTQSRRSIRNVIERAERLFELNADEAEALANSAGLSLSFEGGDLLKYLGYEGRKCDLCRGAVISERMLEYYKKNAYQAGAYRNRGIFEGDALRDEQAFKKIRLLFVGKFRRGCGNCVVYENTLRYQRSGASRGNKRCS